MVRSPFLKPHNGQRMKLLTQNQMLQHNCNQPHFLAFKTTVLHSLFQ